jgi:hypothetical protein
MTFTDDSLCGRSQDLTCAEASDKIVIDKLLVNKLTELLITSIYSVHTSRRSEIFLNGDWYALGSILNQQQERYSSSRIY